MTGAPTVLPLHCRLHNHVRRHGFCRLPRGHCAKNPVPREGASESDKSRLFELCGLRRTVQPDKDSLQTRAPQAKLRGLYYTKDAKGNKCQILKNNEFLVAHCLLSEGRASAIPTGWLRAAPIGDSYLDLSPTTVPQPVVSQPVVYDMPSVPPV